MVGKKGLVAGGYKNSKGVAGVSINTTKHILFFL